MEQPSSSKNPADKPENSSESNAIEVVVIRDGDKDEIFELHDRARDSEQVVIKDAADPVTLLNLHPAVQTAKARSKSIPGLQWILGLTVVAGIAGVIGLSVSHLPTDPLREIVQTAVAAEVTLLAVALGRSEN